MAYQYNDAKEVTNLFLYGQKTTPPSLKKEELIRSDNAPTPVYSVNKYDFMTTGGGRFALGAQFELIQRFFSEELPAGTYSKEYLAETIFGMTSYGWSMQQYDFLDSKGYEEFAERVYIFNSMAFKIIDEAVFVVDENGQKYIQNFGVEPWLIPGANGDPILEDFDLESTDIPTQLLNIIGEPRIDPSGLGRTVNIEFVGETNKYTYTSDSYEIDQIIMSFWETPTLLTTGIKLNTMLDALWDAGVIKYLAGQKPILYGTEGGDAINVADIDEESHPTLADYKPNGAIVFGGKGNDQIYGGAGIDLLYGGKGNDTLYGGDDTDYVEGGGGVDHLYGGDKADIFGLTDGAFVEDATKEDFVTWAGQRVVGGSQLWWMEGGWAYHTPTQTIVEAGGPMFYDALTVSSAALDLKTSTFFRFGLSESSQLIIQYGRGRGGQAVIENYDLDLGTGAASGGVVAFKISHVEDYRVTKEEYLELVNLAWKVAFGNGITGNDPILIDLDGDGIELTRERNSDVHFDFDADGFAEHTAWVKPDDGILVRDLNSNGSIDDITELFGNETTPGLTALDALDSNNDNLITSADTEFGSLRVWQDANEDGVTDAGELKTLAEHGIVSISTVNAGVEDSNIRGNTVRAESVVTRDDGSTTRAYDVLLQGDQIDSVYLGDSTVSSAAAALPNLKGFGNLTNLDIAMTNDATLLDMVEDFAALPSSTSFSAIQSDVIDILFRWAGVDGVTPTAIGSNGLDTQQLAFLEKYFGYDLAPRDGSGNPTDENDAEIIDSWETVLLNTTVRLAAQGPLDMVFASVPYHQASDRFLADDASDFADTVTLALQQLSSNATTAMTEWDTIWAPMLNAYADAFIRPDKNRVHVDYVVQGLVKALDSTSVSVSLQQLVDGLGLENVFLGDSGNNTLARGSAVDTAVFVGGEGNDTMTGGNGQDVYVFGSDFGDDVIIDSDALGQTGDRIRFATHSASEVTMARDGEDLVITATATGDTVTVKDMYEKPTFDVLGLPLTPDHRIEEIQFADGTIYEAGDISAIINLGTNGADSIVGTAFADEIEGLQGNDTLEGGDDGDLYVFSPGDGQDIIFDQMTSPFVNAPDVALFMGGIEEDDLSFIRNGNSDDLTLSYGTAGDTITITNQFHYNATGYDSDYSLNNRIELLHFSSGYSIDWLEVQRRVLDTYTTENDDVTYGFGTSDTIDASAGNDLLIGRDGGDTYRFTIGSGEDTISDSSKYPETFISGLVGHSWGSNDVVEFGEGIAVEDVTFTRLGSTPDLTITIEGSSDTLTIEGQFDSTKLDLFNLLGVAWFDRVEEFRFADGTTLSWYDVLLDVLEGTDGDDVIYGTWLDETLDGGAGNDTLSGSDGEDTYIFGAGYGQDIITDSRTNVLSADNDTLRFAEGINVSDIVFDRDPEDFDALLITLDGTSDSLRIEGHFDIVYTGVFAEQYWDRIENFVWEDGTAKTWQNISAELLVRYNRADSDVILATHEGDTIVSGAGNDTMLGGNGGDTYMYALGDGHDVIDDNPSSIFAHTGDRIVFGAGILPEDIILSRQNYDDLVITFENNTSDSITIDDQFAFATVGPRHYEIESFQFSNGTIWNKAHIEQFYIIGNQTAGNDTILGFDKNDTLVGGAGNDLLKGGPGDDWYYFESGFGQDTIEESLGYVTKTEFDTIEFGAGISAEDVILTRNVATDDLVISFAGSSDQITLIDQFRGSSLSIGPYWDIDQILFSDGTQWSDADIRQMMISQSQTAGNDVVHGFGENKDIIRGGLGDDTLHGYGGNDVYIYDLGDGHDVIDTQSISYDGLLFGSGLTQSDITVSADGDDLILTMSDGGSIRIIDEVLNGEHEIAYFEFANATFYFAADMLAFAAAGGQITGNIGFADTVTGTSGDDVITITGNFDNLYYEGLAGDDSIRAYNGDDSISGGAGNDTLYGAYGRDTLYGGQGDDLLKGDSLDDLYIYFLGDGNDTITEYTGNNDQLYIAGETTSQDVTFSIEGLNLKIHFADGGSILIEDQFQTDGEIESVRFSGDGVVLTESEIRQSIITNQFTDGNDTVSGFGWSDDTLEGGLGDDSLFGGGRNDTFIYNLGDGNDTIQADYGDLDSLILGADIAPEDITFSVTDGSIWGDNLLMTFAEGGSILVLNHFGSFDIDLLTLQFTGITYTSQNIKNFVDNNAGLIPLGDDGINDDPVLVNEIENQSATQDTLFTFQIPADTFADIDADTLSYTATQIDGSALPAWLSFDAATRTFSGTPQESDEGVLEIQVRVTDGHGGVQPGDVFSITVSGENSDPVLSNPIADQNATEGAVFSFLFASNVFTDADTGDTLTYSATLENGSALPAWLSFDAATRTFSGTPDTGDVGTIAVKVTADDGNGGTVDDVFDLVVAAATPPGNPITGTNSGETLNGTSGADYITALAGNDDIYAGGGNDTVSSGAGDDYIELGAGNDVILLTLTDSSSASGVDYVGDFAQGQDRLDVSAMGYTDVSDFSVYQDSGYTEIYDSSNGFAIGFDSGTLTLTNADFIFAGGGAPNNDPALANAIADQNATEGSAFSFQFASNTFSDADAGDTLTYSATLSNDAALPSWLTFNASTRTFSGTPLDAHTGAISIKVAASDGHGGTPATDIFMLTVADINNAPTVANAIANQNATEDSAFNFQFATNVFADLDAGDTLTYSATLNSGGALPSWLSFNTSTRTFSGTPDAGDVGTIAVKVTANDGHGGTVNDVFDIVVGGINHNPTVANPIPNQSATEGTAFTYQILLNAFADQDAGDVLTYSATKSDGAALPSWLTFNAPTRTFTGTPLDANTGAFDVKVTVNDGNGGSVDDVFTVTVADINNAPTVANAIADQNATEDAAFSFQFASNVFADVDAGDTLTYSATLNGGGALPSWLSFNASNRTFSGTPDAGDVGTIAVKVTANDGHSGTVNDVFDLTVTANSGPTFDNTITGSSSNNTLIGTSDNDLIYGLGGADTITAEEGNDSVEGGNGADVIYGWTGNDTLIGGDGADELGGDDGHDSIVGGNGNDDMFGWTGDDTLIGGAGGDYLEGGAGVDIFKYTALSDSTAAQTDYIGDFVSGTDKIDLSGLGFANIQSGAASGTTLGYTSGGGYTEISNAAGTFFIGFDGNLTFNSGDFIFS